MARDRGRVTSRRLAHLLQLVALLALTADPAAPLHRVSDIQVHGNARTERDVIVRALGVRPGDHVSDAGLRELRQHLLNLRLFQEVEIARRPAEGGVVLEVSVKERWTLIPIPIAGASAGTFRAGLAVLESNLLGRQKLLVVSALYSSRGSTAFVMYRDPALLGTRAVLAAEVTAEEEVRERADGDEVVYAWRDRLVDASVRPGLRLAPRLRALAGPFFLHRRSRAEPGHAAPPVAGRDLGIAAELEYDGQDQRDWFAAGPAARARVRRSLPALGSDRGFTQASAHGAWSVGAFGGHAATAALSAYLARGDEVLDAFQLGGRPGSRGLRDAGLWVERGATATLDYQVPVWRPRWGTVTGAGFVDAGVSTWSGERTRYLAPGVGLRVYLRSVALPAMGLDLAASTAQPGVATSFFLGFGS